MISNRRNYFWVILKIRENYIAILAFLVIAWAAFWLAWNAATFSIAADETVYAPSGVRMLSRGDIIMNSEHPPLNKILSGLFVLPFHPRIDKALSEVPDNNQWQFGDIFLFESGNPTDAMMFAGRLPSIIATLLMLASVWLFMAKRFHPLAGLGAVASLAFNPNVLAHGALTTNDMYLTVAVWFLFIATYNVVEKPRAMRFILFGLAAGLVLIAKFSGVFFVALAALAVLVLLIWRRNKFKTIALGVIVALLACLALVWLAYMLIEYRSLIGARTIDVVVPTTGQIAQVGNRLIKILLVPFLRYKEGYDVVKGHNAIGHNAYLNGTFSMTGFREFFILNLWYKTPTALLLLIAIGAIWASIKRQWIIVTLFIAALLTVAAASFGHIHIGIRHILPVFALLAPAAGYGLWRLIASRQKTLYVLLAAMAVWLVYDLAQNSPSKISYFSEISGGWENGYKHLSDSNTDWGQEVKLLVKWHNDHPDEELIIGYASGEDPAYRGVPYKNVTDIGRYTACDGIADNEVLITSVNVATGLFGPYPCIMDKIPKADRLGHTFLVFYPDDFK